MSNANKTFTTTFDILRAKKADRDGRPLTFTNLNEFITWARITSGDSFATADETETLKSVREHGFDVAKGYIKDKLVEIGDLTEEERDLCGLNPVCAECHGKIAEGVDSKFCIDCRPVGEIITGQPIEDTRDFSCCGSANGFHLTGCPKPIEFPGTWDVPVPVRDDDKALAEYFAKEPYQVEACLYECCGHVGTPGQQILYGDKCPRCGSESSPTREVATASERPGTQRLETSGEVGLGCPACGCSTKYNQSQDTFYCVEENCDGKRMPKSRIERLITNEGLTLTDVIDVVCELNGFVGVGYITFGDQIGEYIKDKSSKGFNYERFMNN